MAKLPSSLLPGRAYSAFSSPASHTLLLSTGSRTAITAAAATSATPQLASPLAGNTQVRHATLIRRPQRPYTFTQLVQLSDGSTYTVRTTSPHGMYKSAKDTRNHARWQPSDRSLRNIEVDEAGKLAAFRLRYGRGWDSAAAPPDESMTEEEKEKAQRDAAAQEEIDLTSLIGGYADAAGMQSSTGMNAKEAAKAEKKNSKKKK